MKPNDHRDSVRSAGPQRVSVRIKQHRKQIEDSPSIESHKRVSRRYEEEYYLYYGWPFYWRGNALWGMSGFPILDLPSNPFPSEQAKASDPALEGADAHLRSTNAVNGYRLQASDGTIGHVSDFMMDARTWAISRLVVRTGHRLSGREVLIPTSKVDRISYEESKVFVALTGEAVEQSSAHTLTPAGAAP